MPAHVVRAANVAKIETIWTEGVKQWVNIFHIAYGGVAPLDVPECSSLASNFRTAYMANIGLFVNPACSLTDVHVTDIDPAGFAAGDDFSVSPGANGGTLQPASACWVITWHNTLPSFRGGKAKTFVGGMSDGDITAGRTITPASRTNMATHANAFIAAVNSISFGVGPRTCELITLSVRSGGAFRPTPVQAQVASATVNSPVRTQRRRIEP